MRDYEITKNDMNEITAKDRRICPGGFHSKVDHLIIGFPALSRYGHGEICSDCGVREAFEGDFIKI